MPKKIAEKLTGKVIVNLDGKEWPIVVTHNLLIETEELTGLNTLTGEANMVRPSAKLVRAILFLALKHAGAKYSLEQVGDLITPQNLVPVQEAILTAWAASMPEPEERPTPAAPTP